ncbi:MAG TPA: DUF4260 family protein [Arthrobacter sp.]|nr:DUF4260 family protein [Arthrobacter sp.]
MSTTTIQRVENAAIAAAIVLAMIAYGQSWWLLLAAFLLFDLSALGYLRSSRTGAVTYNLVHNYTGPAVVLSLYVALVFADHHVTWLALLAACWAFHVATDRALGYGLKLEDFAHTHLGRIGRARTSRSSPWSEPATLLVEQSSTIKDSLGETKGDHQCREA